MDLTEDSFRALARSSPWRWRTLHFIHRSGGVPEVAGDHVEAWLTRPDGIRIVGVGGWQPLGNSLPQQRPDGRPTGPWEPPEPAYRSDGLVARRPGSPWAQTMLCDDLFWRNYQWVAMLDPVELSHHVAVDELRVDEVAGRLSWRARLVAEDGYEPRCGGNCCELLYSEVALRCDFPNPEEVPEAWRGRTYPDAHDVALDVETGVVVRCLPIGGPDDAPWLENDILEVDEDLEDVFAAYS